MPPLRGARPTCIGVLTPRNRRPMGRGSLSPAPQHPGTAVKGTRSRHFRSEESALRPPLSGCRHSSDRRSRLRARQLNPAPLTSRCPHFAARAAILDAGPPGSVSPPSPHIRVPPLCGAGRHFGGRGHSHPLHRLHPGTAIKNSGRPCWRRGHSAKLRLPHPGTITKPCGRPCLGVGHSAPPPTHPGISTAGPQRQHRRRGRKGRPPRARKRQWDKRRHSGEWPRGGPQPLRIRKPPSGHTGTAEGGSVGGKGRKERCKRDEAPQKRSQHRAALNASIPAPAGAGSQTGSYGSSRGRSVPFPVRHAPLPRVSPVFLPPPRPLPALPLLSPSLAAAVRSAQCDMGAAILESASSALRPPATPRPNLNPPTPPRNSPDPLYTPSMGRAATLRAAWRPEINALGLKHCTQSKNSW